MGIITSSSFGYYISIGLVKLVLEMDALFKMVARVPFRNFSPLKGLPSPNYEVSRTKHMVNKMYHMEPISVSTPLETQRLLRAMFLIIFCHTLMISP